MANGEYIEQTLGRVGVPAIPGINNVNLWLHMTRDQVRRSTLRMPHDKHIRMHGGEIVHRVQQRLTLGLRRSRYVEIDHIRRQPLSGNFKGSACTGAGLEK